MMLYIIQTLPKHATRPKKQIPPVLPRTYEQEWRNWECTKNEFQNMYVPEEIFWEPGSSLTESHVCFTVSPSLGLPVFWLFSVWLFWVGRFCCLCCFVGWLVSPLCAYGMHKFVVISKTVTIVMMSAAMEQKKGRSQCVLSQDYFIVDPSVHLWLQAVRTRTATIVMMSAVIGQKKLLAADIFCGPSSQDLLGRVSPAQEFFFRRSHWLCHWLFSFAWSDFYVETDCVAVFTPFIGLPLVVCLGFTTSRRRTFERTLKLLVFARFVSLVFHAVSLCGQHVLFSRYRCLLSYDRMRTLVTGISNPMAALRRSSSFSCAPSMTWLRKGFVVFWLRKGFDLGGSIFFC